MSSFKFDVCEKIFDVKRNLKQYLIEKSLLVITCTNKMFNDRLLYCIKQGIVHKKTLLLLCVRKKSVRKLKIQCDINNYGVSKQLGVFMEKKIQL